MGGGTCRPFVVAPAELKELKMSYKIGDHDYDVRKKQALRFLNQGNKVCPPRPLPAQPIPPRMPPRMPPPIHSVETIHPRVVWQHRSPAS